MGRFVRPISFLAVFAIIFSYFPPPQRAGATLDTEPTRKVKIVIQASKIDATLTDFPVLIARQNIPDEACDADGASPAQNGGGDIRFTSDENGNNQLPLEVVDFTTANDPANCTVEMYVKVPSIDETTDTSIWMWYNTAASDSQPAVDSTYGRENVWGSAYKGVWHTQESSGTRADATTNDNDLTDNATVASATGKIGTAADFEKDNNEYLSISDNTSLSITGDLSASIWVKLESAPSSGSNYYFMSKYLSSGNQRSYGMHYEDNTVETRVEFDMYSDGSAGANVLQTQTLTPGGWYQLAYTYDDAGTVKIYLNGTVIKTETSSIPGSIYDGTALFALGANANSAGYMDGLMDEARISTSARSAAWVKAEYENTNDPAAFAIEEAPQDASTAPESATVIKSADETVTSSTTLQDDNEFTFTLAANTQYVVNGGIFATSTSATPDIKIGFTVPTGATMDIGYLAQGGTNRSAELLETPGSASARIIIPANTNTIIQPFGSIVTGGSGGTLTFQWAQFVSNGTATKVKQGSFMTVTEVTEE